MTQPRHVQQEIIHALAYSYVWSRNIEYAERLRRLRHVWLEARLLKYEYGTDGYWEIRKEMARELGH